MAYVYARANLVDLGDVTGYSNTSGGPSRGALPSSNDTLVFDSSSGPSRTITGSTPGLGICIDMSAGPSMYFTGTLTLIGNSVLKGTVYGLVLSCLRYDASNPVTFTLDTAYLTVGDGGLSMVYTPGKWNLISSWFYSTGAVSVTGGLFAQNMVLTCASFSVSGSDGLLYAGTSSLDLIITGFTTTTLPVVSLSTSTVNGSVRSLTLTDTGANTKNVSIPGLTMNFANNTGNTQGTGGVKFSNGSGLVFNTFDAGKGAITALPGGYTHVANNWILDGAGQYNQIGSTTTSAAVISKAGGGVIAANFCSFSTIAVQLTPTVTSIRATNSKMTGSTGITLVGMTSRFMPFF